MLLGLERRGHAVGAAAAMVLVISSSAWGAEDAHTVTAMHVAVDAPVPTELLVDAHQGRVTVETDGDVLVCYGGSPASKVCERFSFPGLAAVVNAASTASRYEPVLQIKLRERCLGALGISSDERARQILNDYVAQAAIAIKNGPTKWSGASQPHPTVDPALPEAVQQTPTLHPYAVEVLRRALVVHAVGTDALQEAVCGKPVPGESISATTLDACRAGPSPETGWELTSQRHRRLMVLGAHALVAGGVMTAGALTRNEPGWRAFSVTSATFGGIWGGSTLGFAIGESQPCSTGALCGLGTGVGIVLGAVLGAAAGFGAGMLLSSHGGAGRVTATGIGVGIYLSTFTYVAFHDWNTLRRD